MPDPMGPCCGRAIRIGSVSYLNAKPLIWGLESEPSVQLLLDVPARLLDGMRAGRSDVALLPSIDYQRMDGLTIIPAGGIGCDGPTLTVRIFSRTPINEITTLACDVESHTSVALARIILAEQYGLHPEFVQLERNGDAASYKLAASPFPPAMLLIGDKVVCEEPRGMPHQLDLGAAWRDLTGLPFVFAVWMARSSPPAHTPGSRLAPSPGTPGEGWGEGVFDRLNGLLCAAKDKGRQHIDDIIQRDAIPRGWPADIARQYLTRYLQYDIGPRHLDAMRLFHELAAKHHMLSAPPRPLVLV